MQLGFSVPPEESTNTPLGHQSPQWSNWDGGKIGGRPSWLNPRDLPQEVLTCRGPCAEDGEKKDTPLCFITQLYCPADDVREEAFHRSLYVFACPKCCSGSSALMQSVKNASNNDNNSAINQFSGCIQVLRCQLPKDNEFYPSKGDLDKEWDKHKSQYWAKHEDDDKLNLCAVCGQRSKGKCPKQNKWFCCPDHQKEHLRAAKKLQDETTSPIPLQYLSSICYESELVVEEEPQPTENGTEKDVKQTTNKSLFESGEITDADSNLEQSDLNEMTLKSAATGVTDSTTLTFYARMAIGGEENDVRDQCLRYCRWPESKNESSDVHQDDDIEDTKQPLWLTSNNQPPKEFPPPCQYCGAPRLFEFQILPQMLHYLLRDSNAQDETRDNSKVLTETERAILLEASSKIESGADLPPGFREQHEQAVAKARDALLGVGIHGNKDSLEWGTIAIYTCTASCGDGDVVSPGEMKNVSVTEKDRMRSLGAYREEMAWLQSSLD